MERRFDMTNFEQSLKDHADHFTIVPSRKVWYGLYNDLHPGSRWPSIAMGLVFLFSLLGIGHLNNSSRQLINQDQSIINENGVSSSGIPQEPESETSLAQSSLNEDHKSEKKSGLIIDFITGNNIVDLNLIAGILDVQENQTTNASLDNILGDNADKRYQIIKNTKAEEQSTLLNVRQDDKKVIPGQEILITQEITDGYVIKNNDRAKIYLSQIDNINFLNFNHSTHQINSGIIIPVIKLSLNNPIAGAEITDNNKEKKHVVKKKRNTKVEWIYFVTPKITSAYFTGKPIPQSPSYNLSPLVMRPNQVGNNMMLNAKLGFEIGTEMQFKFAEKWQLISGVQLSYSGYNIISHRVHPTLASLIVRSDNGLPYSKNYITYYGNGHSDNQIVLPNYNLQASIPVGLQYEIWGNKNIKIHLASTVQPSLVLNSHGYLLSSNGKNYVEDPDLMRAINLSANFASMITFQSKKVKWHIGPNVRYQILSSYKDIYPVKEHLIDYGIKIGISK